MSAPAGLLAASTLLWGWMCELTPVAVPLAMLLEAWRFTGLRWDLSPKDFQRFADFCTWAFVLQAGYLIVAKGWPLPILGIVQWLPPALAPLVLAQLYSSAGRIELSALFLSLRAASAGALARERVDLSFAYAAICVLAAGAANVRTPWYFAAAVALVLWALWGVRSRRYPVWLWVGLVTIAVGAGYAGHQGLSRLQAWVFNIAIDYFQLDLARTDPYRSTTDIGHIGELKSSDRILLRVALPSGAPVPLLLHRASYDVYSAASWFARDGQFGEQLADDGSGRWALAQPGQAQTDLTVSETLPNGVGVLALPSRTVAVSGLAPATLKRNRFGTVRVERAPGMIHYAASGAAGTVDRSSDPRASDLQLPANDARALGEIAGRLGLAGLPAQEAARAIETFFAAGFRYTTFREKTARAGNPIAEFLLESRAGHCEYFATATVLLARAAGIPARYATGFSVQEFSEIERRYVVRERHAHAWARLYFDGAWHDVDTTPPQWFAQEARSASFLEPFTDIVSWLMFRINEWRARPVGDREAIAWYAALALLFAILTWRLFRGRAFARAAGAPGAPAHAGDAGRDSPFRAIEQRMARRGLPRSAAETPREWVARIAPRFGPEHRPALDQLLRFHYRHCFDPVSMSAADRHAYALAARRWLESDPLPLPIDASSGPVMPPASNVRSIQAARSAP